MRTGQEFPAGRMYFLTRRTPLGQYLIHPDCAEMNEIVWYCLGLATERTGAEVHQATVMSNHPHITVTDVNGNLPAFMEHLNKSLACSTNRLRGRNGQVFDLSRSKWRELLDEATVVQKIAYSVVNPVNAGLVSRASQWPGVCVLPEHMGTLVKTVKRPDACFSASADLPAEVTVRITVPPAFAHRGVEGWQAMVSEAVARREEEIREERAAAGLGFLGRRAVQREIKWWDVPSAEPKPRGRFSRWAGPKDLCKERQAQHREFVSAHEAACERFKRGVPAVFPAGTWWMKKVWGVPCEGDPTRPEAAVADLGTASSPPPVSSATPSPEGGSSPPEEQGQERPAAPPAKKPHSGSSSMKPGSRSKPSRSVPAPNPPPNDAAAVRRMVDRHPARPPTSSGNSPARPVAGRAHRHETWFLIATVMVEVGGGLASTSGPRGSPTPGNRGDPSTGNPAPS